MPVAKKRRTEYEILIEENTAREIDEEVVIPERQEGDSLVLATEEKYKHQIEDIKGAFRIQMQAEVGDVAQMLARIVEGFLQKGCGALSGGGVPDPTVERDFIAEVFLPVANTLMEGPELKEAVRTVLTPLLECPSKPEVYNCAFFCKWACDGTMPPVGPLVAP